MQSVTDQKASEEPEATEPEPKNATISIRNLDFLYGENQVLHDVSLDIFPNEVMAFIGPSGCGKSTLLRCLNRMNDLVAGAKIGKGSIEIHGTDLQNESGTSSSCARKWEWSSKNRTLSPSQSTKT